MVLKDKYKRYFFLLFLAFLIIKTGGVKAQDSIIYKKIEAQKHLVLLPFGKNSDMNSKAPCLLLLSGGGWVNFSWSQLFDVANPLVKKGAKAFVVQYRTSKAFPGATPMDALEDVQDAIFFMRENADMYNIDKNQIIAIGSSAGAQLAFAAQLANPRGLKQIKDYSPNLIVAYSPVIRNDSLGYAYKRISAKNRWFSPWNVYMESDARIPAAQVFSGKEDHLINIEDLKKFKERAGEKGDVFNLEIIDNVGHSMRNTIPDIFDRTNPLVLSFLEAQEVQFAPRKGLLMYLFIGIVAGILGLFFLLKKFNKKN